MSKSSHTMTFTRSSEANDGTVTGEEEVRVTFAYYPAEPMTVGHPGAPDDVFIERVEVERLIDARLGWVPTPQALRPGDFDYHEWVEDNHRDDMIDRAIADRLAAEDRRDDAKIARLRGVS